MNETDKEKIQRKLQLAFDLVLDILSERNFQKNANSQCQCCWDSIIRDHGSPKLI